MNTALDDQEQIEYNSRWMTNKRKMQASIRWIRQAHADGAISWIRMETLIWQTKRKYRREWARNGSRMGEKEWEKPEQG